MGRVASSSGGGGSWCFFFIACMIMLSAAFGMMTGATGPLTPVHFALLVACPGVLALCVALVAVDREDAPSPSAAAVPLMLV